MTDTDDHLVWRLRKNETAKHLCSLAADAIERLRAKQPICGACGHAWTGDKCGQADNGHPFPVCYPYVPAIK